MPWKEKDVMSLRMEFVQLALQSGSNIRELCRRYKLSSRTGYKWIKRYREEGEQGLLDKSKEPQRSPKRTDEKITGRILSIREETGWGGRKIARTLEDQGYEGVPHPNTITDILRRSGKLDQRECQRHQPYQRYEYGFPNEMWQMDFKGHFAMLIGRCHPFTVLDDHSRFCVGLYACGDETSKTTMGRLQTIFRLYGLPKCILCDNGGPWGSGYPELELSHLAVWLLRLGVQIKHGRPSHPQTQGKDERFHRTLKSELLQRKIFSDLIDCQHSFDLWRDRYNSIRPHESLQLDTPVQHYYPSPIPFPEVIPPVEYNVGEILRKVQKKGEINFHNLEFKIGKGLFGEYVAIRPTVHDGIFDVFFGSIKVSQIDLISQDC
jgi:transposase InsO family protein